MHIRADGDVEACPFAPYPNSNLRDSSLKEALQSEMLATIRHHSDQLGEGLDLPCNVDMGVAEVREFCRIGGAERGLLQEAMTPLGRSTRSYH